jgi:stalled ribosome rescue protein Dom34
MGIEYAETITNHKTNSIGNRTAIDYIKDWRKTKADLLKRAGELKKRSEALKMINPVLAADLEKRSRKLAKEAAAMSKPGKDEKHISTDRIRRAAAVGRLELIKDKR